MMIGFAMLAVMAMSPGEDANAPAVNGTAANAPARTARFDEGRNLFDSGHYAEAAEIFTRLHVESGDATLLYPAAQSLRLAGRCAEALAAYQGFVDAKAQLLSRAEATGPESRVKRLVSDLDFSGARIVEMRTCGGRLSGQDVRSQAQLRRVSGDAAGAITLLSPLWDQTADPTILPDLADLHRTLGDCQRAATLFDLAITALTPIEVLAEVGAEGSDLTAARNALQRARTANAAPACVPRTTAAKSASTGPAAVVTAAPEVNLVERGGPEKVKPAPPRWPLWMAGAGGALLIGGGVFAILTYQTKNQIEALRTQPWDAGKGQQLLDRRDWYERGTLALSITGGVIVAAASVYYLSARRRDPTTGPGVQISAAGTTLFWTGQF